VLVRLRIAHGLMWYEHFTICLGAEKVVLLNTVARILTSELAFPDRIYPDVSIAYGAERDDGGVLMVLL
jgi:hypothetical protein